MIAEELEVDRVRMVKVDLLPDLHRKVAGVLVVGVLRDHNHSFLQLLGYRVDHRGFS